MTFTWPEFLKRSGLFCLFSALVYFPVFQAFWWRDAVGAFYFGLPVFGLAQGVLAYRILGPVLRLVWWRVFLVAVVLTPATGLVFAYVGLESGACLFMGMPLIAPAQLAGIFLAKWRGRNSGQLNASLLVLVLLAPQVDMAMPYPKREQIVRTEVRIDATPAVVWQNTLTIPEIGPDERVWTFSHNIMGVPQPVSAEFRAGTRYLRWTEGVSLREIVTALEPARRIAWEFDFQDQAALRAVDPHISPNSQFTRLRQGEYMLEPLADGGTLLVLQTTLDIATPLNIYFGAWAERILQDFHKSVLRVIQTRSEAETL